MRYRLVKQRFEKLVSQRVPELFGPLGFGETDPGYLY